MIHLLSADLKEVLCGISPDGLIPYKRLVDKPKEDTRVWGDATCPQCIAEADRRLKKCREDFEALMSDPQFIHDRQYELVTIMQQSLSDDMRRQMDKEIYEEMMKATEDLVK